MMWPLASYKKIIFTKINDKSDPELDPDPLIRGMDPGIQIRIRTKMSQIPNTGKECLIHINSQTIRIEYILYKFGLAIFLTLLW
jgi:hypothetical protein